MSQAQHHLRGARRSGGHWQPISRGPGGFLTEVGTKLEKPCGPHGTDSAWWPSSGWLRGQQGGPGHAYGDIWGHPLWAWKAVVLDAGGEAGSHGGCRGGRARPPAGSAVWGNPRGWGLAVRTSGTAIPTAPAFQGLMLEHGLESRPLMSPGSHCPEHPDVWGLRS